MGEIYFIRHEHSCANQLEKVFGVNHKNKRTSLAPDADITYFGVHHGLHMAKKLELSSMDGIIYCSQLVRTAETAIVMFHHRFIAGGDLDTTLHIIPYISEERRELMGFSVNNNDDNNPTTIIDYCVKILMFCIRLKHDIPAMNVFPTLCFYNKHFTCTHDINLAEFRKKPPDIYDTNAPYTVLYDLLKTYMSDNIRTIHTRPLIEHIDDVDGANNIKNTAAYISNMTNMTNKKYFKHHPNDDKFLKFLESNQESNQGLYPNIFIITHSEFLETISKKQRSHMKNEYITKDTTLQHTNTNTNSHIYTHSSTRSQISNLTYVKSNKDNLSSKNKIKKAWTGDNMQVKIKFLNGFMYKYDIKKHWFRVYRNKTNRKRISELKKFTIPVSNPNLELDISGKDMLNQINQHGIPPRILNTVITNALLYCGSGYKYRSLLLKSLPIPIQRLLFLNNHTTKSASGGSMKPKKKSTKKSTKKPTKKSTKKSKVYTGVRGGQYIIKNKRKVYLPSK